LRRNIDRWASIGFDLSEAPDRFTGVEPDCFGKGKKLNHFGLSLPAFNGRDEGLRWLAVVPNNRTINPPNTVSKCLRKTGADPIQLIVYKNSNHAFMFKYTGKYVVKGATETDADCLDRHLSWPLR
jgi:hypothetical protein